MHTEAPSIRKSSCPMDCPDACTLDVSVLDGKVVGIDGNNTNPVTNNYICRKIHHFTEHMYGPDRILHPAVRVGPKGSGKFRRVSWDEALDKVVEQFSKIKAQHGGEAILPYCYGGSNGYLTQDSVDARFFRRLQSSRLARTLCAAATGRAARGLYGGMPGVAYPDYVNAKLIVLWGVNPSASGIHLVPFIKQARKNGAKLIVVDPVRTQLAGQADLHIPLRPGTDVVVALAIANWFFENNRADEKFLAEHALQVDEYRNRAARWSINKAAQVAGVEPADLEHFAKMYADISPAVIRCGWGLERNRNGGSGVASVLALPAVAGKFGVKSGGYTMSNTPVWDLVASTAAQEPEANTRIINMNQLGKALTEYNDPPIHGMFVYNANPVASTPHQNKVIKGLLRDDLFTVVFEQVMTDTAMYADVLLPATTFLEHHELYKGYGSLILNRYSPAADRVGEARPNIEVFADLCKRMGLAKPDDVEDAEELMRMIMKSSAQGEDLVARIGSEDGSAFPAIGTSPVQFVTVFPRTGSGKIELIPVALDEEAPGGLYHFRPLHDAKPLSLVSPATAKTISSTLAQIWSEPAEVLINPIDAESRDLTDGKVVRVYNDLGEVECKARITNEVRPGVVLMHKGYWRKHTRNGFTATALAPDSLTDLGGGACFNDATVEVSAV